MRKQTSYIVFHTAAFNTSKGAFNVNVCDEWHKARGWKGCGYNYIITAGTHGDVDGQIQVSMRGEEGIGAHCRGINSVSIGICVAGNGNEEVWTDNQAASFYLLTNNLMKKYGVLAKNVIGHREIGTIFPKYATTKTCPGTMIDCDTVRSLLS